ncbi:MAG: bile acid:sodium symporter family protein [Ahrensia sp.]|nr:bile acid:sodium symporter family protein [Ahrensia sp.]
MDILLQVFLPLSLAFIMFSLGLGLTLADFSRVAKFPKAFAIGAISQVVLLPLITLCLILAFGLTGELAVGVMILSFCPGGVTSNIMTKFAGGALALSITLTAVVSLLAVFTVPIFVSWSADFFMGADAPPINVTTLAISMFLITAVPVAIGVALRRMFSATIICIEPAISRIASILFIIIVVGALAANWTLFIENVVVLGPLLIVLNIVLVLLGFGLGTVAGLDVTERATVAIETGVQNSTLGITVGSLIVETLNGLPPFSLPSGVYGITMYFVTLPFLFWMRSKTRRKN